MVVIASIYLGFSGFVYAETHSHGEQTENRTAALNKANAYSFETGGIGILINYGTNNGVSADAIGEAFVNELKKRGYKARYYFYNTSGDGAAMSFRIGYSSLGIWPPSEAAERIGEVTKRADAVHKVHDYKSN